MVTGDFQDVNFNDFAIESANADDKDNGDDDEKDDGDGGRSWKKGVS